MLYLAADCFSVKKNFSKALQSRNFLQKIESIIVFKYFYNVSIKFFFIFFILNYAIVYFSFIFKRVDCITYRKVDFINYSIKTAKKYYLCYQLRCFQIALLLNH